MVLCLASYCAHLSLIPPCMPYRAVCMIHCWVTSSWKLVPSWDTTESSAWFSCTGWDEEIQSEWATACQRLWIVWKYAVYLIRWCCLCCNILQLLVSPCIRMHSIAVKCDIGNKLTERVPSNIIYGVKQKVTWSLAQILRRHDGH